VDGALLTHDYAAAARAWDYRFVRAEVTAIDRAARRVATSVGDFDYDWLVLAVGIRHDYAAWFGDDRETAEYARRQFPSAFAAGPEFAALQEKLARFKGGDFVMLLPPAPYRCPPAPYERAALLAGWLDARGIPGRLIVVDPGAARLGFPEVFARHGRRIDYRPQTRVLTVDPRRRLLRTEFDTIEFDDAILMPPQQAGDLAWQAGLIGRAADGRPSGWAAADPLSYAARADERVFVVGDMLDQVAPAFGHYPKTGQMASRQGRIAARQIAARARGIDLPPEFPDSTCHVATRYDPPESLRIESVFGLGANGELVQKSALARNPRPAGEDLAWAKGMFDEFLAPPAR
jgi:NADPH-dependent 2,4-dienoyl-CoA reductase/sulfur reductase-like enzyme